MSSAFFSLQFPLFKLALEGMTAQQGAILEALFTLLFCLIFMKMRKESVSVSGRWRFVAAGTLNALGLIMLFEGLALLNPATVGFIGRLYFVYCALIGLVYFRERPSTLEGVSIPVVIVGLFLFSFHDFGRLEALGVLAASLYPLAFALQNLIVKDLLRTNGMTRVLLQSKIWSLAVLILYGFVREGVSVVSVSSQSAVLVFVSSFLATFVGLLLFYEALRKTTFSLANVVKGSEIVFIYLFSHLFFPMHLSVINAIGIALVVLAMSLIFVQQLRRARVPVSM